MLKMATHKQQQQQHSPARIEGSSGWKVSEISKPELLGSDPFTGLLGGPGQTTQLLSHQCPLQSGRT